MTKLVCGVGINDAEYQVQKIGTDESTYWKCPFYMTWTGMLARAYSKVTQRNQPTYKGCGVDERWHRFSDFRKWMETQDWKGKQLDKDFLVAGNKMYSPETCVFVSQGVNSAITDSGKARGVYPLGVHRSKTKKESYVACVRKNGAKIYLGSYPTPMEAHRAWQAAKIESIESAVELNNETCPRLLGAIARLKCKLLADIEQGKETVSFHT